MKKILFALGLLLASNAFAATGTGHAQAELSNPLTVTNNRNVNFGIIAIDPAAGSQTISMNSLGVLICPATYVCSGSPEQGYLKVTGEISTDVNIDVTGSTATLSDGAGGTLIFDPILYSDQESYVERLNSGGERTNVGVGGSITFTGNEVAGTYNTTNAGGSGYTVMVNY